jgi:hypothetical protein
VKQSDYQTKEVRCHVQPAGHEHKDSGPHYVYVGFWAKHGLFEDWPHKRNVLVAIEQTDPTKTNFTLLYIMAIKKGVRMPALVSGLNFQKAPWNIMKRRGDCHKGERNGASRVYLKSRLTRVLPHPIPVGQYRGLCIWEDDHVGKGRWALLTLQAATLKKVDPPAPQKERVLVLPGDDEFDLTLAAAKKSLQGDA